MVANAEALPEVGEADGGRTDRSPDGDVGTARDRDGQEYPCRERPAAIRSAQRLEQRGQEDAEPANGELLCDSACGCTEYGGVDHSGEESKHWVSADRTSQADTGDAHDDEVAVDDGVVGGLGTERPAQDEPAEVDGVSEDSLDACGPGDGLRLDGEEIRGGRHRPQAPDVNDGLSKRCREPCVGPRRR